VGTRKKRGHWARDVATALDIIYLSCYPNTVGPPQAQVPSFLLGGWRLAEWVVFPAKNKSVRQKHVGGLGVGGLGLGHVYLRSEVVARQL
jgi:hypothetical protein